MRKYKESIAAGFSHTGLSRAMRVAQRAFWPAHVRALNYHALPSREGDAFERQLAFYAEHFVPVGLEDLLLLAQGRWPHVRPGLLLSFDDGLATHAQVAAPLLEQYGWVGWFLVPSGFVDTPPAEQSAFAATHAITPREEPLADGRVALSWEEVRRLAERHVIGCHTVHHTRFTRDLGDAVVERETAEAKARLEAEIGQPVEVFAWVGGEEQSYSANGAAAVRKAGFRVGMMTNSRIFRAGDDLLQVQRTNVEAGYSEALLHLHLSGFFDLVHRGKRRRVEALTQNS